MAKDKLKVTGEQTQLLCTFFEENPEVIRGYKKTPECIDAVQNKWKKITLKLNTVGPPRDHRAWAKYLCDMKAKLKRKHIKWRQNSSGTGPVMSNADDFNEIKLRMLQILRKYPTEAPDSHESNLSNMEIENTKTQNINNKSHQESTTISHSIDLLESSPVDHRPEFVNGNEYDEFDAIGKHIAQQLRALPLPVALETQEILLTVLRKQRLKLSNGSCIATDPLNKL